MSFGSGVPRVVSTGLNLFEPVQNGGFAFGWDMLWSQIGQGIGYFMDFSLWKV